MNCDNEPRNSLPCLGIRQGIRLGHLREVQVGLQVCKEDEQRVVEYWRQVTLYFHYLHPHPHHRQQEHFPYLRLRFQHQLNPRQLHRWHLRRFCCLLFKQNETNEEVLS